MSEPLFDDPVVADVHAVRARMLAECAGDHERLMRKVREREQKTDRRVVPVPADRRPLADRTSGQFPLPPHVELPNSTG